MSGNLNKALIIGRLTKDPEMRATANGKSVANITVATSKSWKDKSTGAKQERSEFHRVVAFDKLAEIIGQYLKKASQVYIEGEIQTRKWTDNSGVDKYSTEIIASQMTMLDSKGQAEQPKDHIEPGNSKPAADPFMDEIPFNQINPRLP